MTRPLLDFDDAGAQDDHPAKGVTVGDIRGWFDEIERLKADMAQIATIANIPPADERYGSLAVRMEKICLLSR